MNREYKSNEAVRAEIGSISLTTLHQSDSIRPVRFCGFLRRTAQTDLTGFGLDPPSSMFSASQTPRVSLADQVRCMFRDFTHWASSQSANIALYIQYFALDRHEVSIMASTTLDSI